MRYGGLPLHNAIKNLRNTPGRAELDNIRRMIAADPGAVRTAEPVDRMLPLHVATNFFPGQDGVPESIRAEVIQMLCDAYPEAVDISDRWGHIPCGNEFQGGPECKAIMLKCREENQERRDAANPMKILESWGRCVAAEVTAVIDRFAGEASTPSGALLSDGAPFALTRPSAPVPRTPRTPRPQSTSSV